MHVGESARASRLRVRRTGLLLAGLLFAGRALAFPWYAQGENFRGAQLLTAEERKAHVARLQGMKSFEECRQYMSGHYLELDRRAREKNTPLPPVQGDPCEAMKRMGRFAAVPAR